MLNLEKLKIEREKCCQSSPFQVINESFSLLKAVLTDSLDPNPLKSLKKYLSRVYTVWQAQVESKKNSHCPINGLFQDQGPYS